MMTIAMMMMMTMKIPCLKEQTQSARETTIQDDFHLDCVLKESYESLLYVECNGQMSDVN